MQGAPYTSHGWDCWWWGRQCWRFRDFSTLSSYLTWHSQGIILNLFLFLYYFSSSSKSHWTSFIFSCCQYVLRATVECILTASLVGLILYRAVLDNCFNVYRGQWKKIWSNLILSKSLWFRKSSITGGHRYIFVSRVALMCMWVCFISLYEDLWCFGFQFLKLKLPLWIFLSSLPVALCIFMPFSSVVVLEYSPIGACAHIEVVFCVRHVLKYTLLGPFRNNLCFESKKKKEKSFGANRGDLTWCQRFCFCKECLYLRLFQVFIILLCSLHLWA